MTNDDSQLSNLSRRIYLDNVAATPVLDEVLQAMEPYWNQSYGNPGGKHLFGVMAKQAIDTARHTVADIVNVQPDEIIFTGSGTESNNLAIIGTLKYLLREQGKQLNELHLITSSIEHPSVLELFKEYEADGASVTYLKPNQEGIIEAETVRAALQDNTVLISIMAVNNEIGVIQPIEHIGRVILAYKKEHNQEHSYPYLHTDASQAALYTHIDLKKMHADLLTLDGQKMYGPKGVGVLVKTRHTQLSPAMVGGGQEQGLRPGTENVPVIVGLAKAYQLAVADRDKEIKRLHELQKLFFEQLAAKVPTAEINGSKGARLPNNVNISIPGIDNEYVVILLDAKGIACGTRSACMREAGHSYVIESLGLGADRADTSLRFSFGKFTTESDIETTVDTLRDIVTDFDTRQ